MPTNYSRRIFADFQKFKKDTVIPLKSRRRTKRKANSTSNTSSRKENEPIEGVDSKQTDKEVTDENTVVPSNRRMQSSSISMSQIFLRSQLKKSQVQTKIKPPNIVMGHNMNRMTHQTSAITMNSTIQSRLQVVEIILAVRSLWIVAMV